MAKLKDAGEPSIRERIADGLSQLALAPPAILGRKADEATVVRWVADNIDVADPDPATCPAPFAWTLLRECRDRPSFIEFFLEKLWVKLIPSRSALEKEAPKAQDGASVIQLMDRILAHSQEAKSPTAAPKPEPPTVPDAFAAFDPKER